MHLLIFIQGKPSASAMRSGAFRLSESPKSLHKIAMTEFVRTLRHYCRNPRCRMKLKAPVENPREAFCTKGCHSSFYRKRCLVCEAEMVRRTENQLICGKRGCRNALEARSGLGRYLPLPDGVSPLGKPINTGLKSSPADYRPWYIIAAGAAISANTFFCATAGSSLI